MRNRAIEDEVRKARNEIQEETKHMTSSELVSYMNSKGEATAKKYGFRIAAVDEVRQEIYSHATKVSV